MTLPTSVSLGLCDAEYTAVKNWLGRTPNALELAVIAVLWSEHCSYKSSQHHLRRLPTVADFVVQGPGENAGTIEIDDDWCIAFKIESHNHPSFIEPYQGAATGVGGILRDILAMGARPVAILNSLRFGNLTDPATRRLMAAVVRGIADYGNRIGCPTVGGEVFFADCYQKNPLVNVFALGLLKREHLVTSGARGVGNSLLYVGAATGRDGLLGATMASASFQADQPKGLQTVQVGDPFVGKLLLETCVEAVKSGAVVAMQDLGAGGLAVASCEMSLRGQVGLDLDLSRVPLRQTGLTPDEILLSESQERMLLVITQGREKEVIEIFNSWGLDGVIIGQVTANPDWRIFWEQQLIASLPATSLATIMPVYDRPQRPLPSVARLSDLRQYEVVYQDIAKVFEKLLTAPNLASRRWVYRQFDHMVRTNTIGLPGGDAAVVRIKETRKAVAMTVDGNGRYCQIDPYQGAQLAVAESCRNLVVSGARPWAITNGLNLGSPEKGENMTALSAIIDGIAVACRALTVPVTGGNVSLYNETDGQSIYPTPIIGAVGVIDDYFKQLTTPGWKQPGDRIILLGKTQASLGGSEYLSLIYQQECGPLPVVDFETEHAVQASCLAAIQQGLITAAHDIAEGGLLLALAECSLQSRGQLGAVIQLSQELLGALPPPAPLAALLFGESPSRIIVSVRPDNFSTLARLLTEYGVEYCDIGITGGADFVVNLDTQPIVHCPLTDLYQAWSMALTQAIEG